MNTTFTKEYCHILANKCNKNCECIEEFHTKHEVHCKLKPIPEYPEIFICDNAQSIKMNCPYCSRFEDTCVCGCQVRINLYHYEKVYSDAETHH